MGKTTGSRALEANGGERTTVGAYLQACDNTDVVIQIV
jgi:hypothetical protein